jgi:hypothetical protein
MKKSLSVFAIVIATLILAGAGCTGKTNAPSNSSSTQQHPNTAVGITTCPPTDQNRVPLADTGHTVALPKGWCLYEWTKDDPVWQEYPYMGNPEPFLLQSTHGIKNREWAVEYPNGNDIGVACTLYYFVAPVDQTYFDDEPAAASAAAQGIEHISPPINEEYVTKYNVNAGLYLKRKQSYFSGDKTKYYDLFSYQASKVECSTIFNSLK